MALAKAVDCETECLPGQMEGGIFGELLAKLSEKRFDRLLALGRGGTGFLPLVDLPLRLFGIREALGNFVFERFEPAFDGRQSLFKRGPGRVGRASEIG